MQDKSTHIGLQLKIKFGILKFIFGYVSYDITKKINVITQFPVPQNIKFLQIHNILNTYVFVFDEAKANQLILISEQINDFRVLECGT